ncbi:MAG TPA: hypothetical protein VKA49_23460, partial [Flavitalea sp.]|nr:hypothetical protein [Flavitalea sp.]
RENYNEARFSAKYRIVEKVCGNYAGDTITFDVIKLQHDSSFKRSKYLLLILTKDSGQNEEFVLWGDLYNDLFKTANGQWVGPYSGQDIQYASGKSSLKPRRIKFSKEAFYNTTGMTREEIDITFPDPFYKIKKDKAIPILGNSITELFQFHKDGILRAEHIYSHPDTAGDGTGTSFVIQDVQLEEIQPYNYDSSYLLIKDTLSKDPFNETNIWKLMKHCNRQDTLDDCSQFFESLILNYPDSARAYLLKAKFMHARPSLQDSSRILVLQQALRIDSNNYETNYELALSFYQLFRKRHSPYYAHTARKWFMRTANIDTVQLPFLKYPIIQLSNYLNDPATINLYNKFQYRVRTNEQGIPTANRHNWYFPFESFLTHKKDWMIDYKIDMIREIQSAYFHLDWFSESLAWFEEPILRSAYKGNVYRLLWLRSFHVPVVIRLQKNKGRVSICWKVPQYNANLDSYDSPAEFKKRITKAQWKKFQKLLATIDYWSMISKDYLSTCVDGAIWLLEASINGRYKVTERNGCTYQKYTKCLSYLISLTDLNIRNKDIY